MSLFRFVFPQKSRDFPGKRWLNVMMRTLHICSATGYGGGVLLNLPYEQIRIYYIITAISGLVMVLVDVFSNGIWLIQNRGWLILLKIVLLGNLWLITPYEKWGLLAIIALSSIVSHGTANFRYYSPFFRKRIEEL